jgi:nickel transport protein
MPTPSYLHNKQLFLLLACLLLFPSEGLAHKIRVFAWVSGNTVTVESGFANNRPLLNGEITIKDNKEGTVLLQGIGDENGIFTFPVPDQARAEASDLLIIVSGGEGHQNQWLLSAAEYLPQGEEPTPERKPSLPPTASPSSSTEVNNTELKQLITEVLEEQLAPIRRSLAKAENKKPTINDILGGIGYLIGLAGLAAWLKNRSPQKTTRQQDI